MYAMIWCMSFTVCAYDDPIADMAVGSGMALLSEVTETEGIAEAVPDAPDIVPGDAVIIEDMADEAAVSEDDATVSEGADGAETLEDGDILIEDDIVGDVSEDELPEEELNDAALNTTEESSKLMSTDGIAFNISTLTITDVTKMYRFKVEGTGNTKILNTNNLTYSIDGLSLAERDQVRLSVADTQFFLEFTGLEFMAWPRTVFVINAYYDDNGAKYEAKLKVAIYVPREIEMWCYLSNGVEFWDTSILEDYDISRPLTIDMQTENDYDKNKLIWEVYDVTNDKVLDADGMAAHGLTLTNSTDKPYRKKILSYGTAFDGITVEVRTRYNNDYYDAEDHLVPVDRPVLAYARIIPKYYKPVTAITMDRPNMTVRTINETVSFIAKGVQEGNARSVLDPDYISYWISPNNDGTELLSYYQGVSAGRSSYNQSRGYIGFDASYRLENLDEFYVVAKYTKTEPALYSYCKVKVALPLNSTYVQYGYSDISKATMQIKSDNTITFKVKTYNDGKIVDPRWIDWTVYEITDGKRQQIEPADRGINFSIEKNEKGVWLRDTVTLSFAEGFTPGLFEFAYTYANYKIKDAVGKPIDETILSDYVRFSVTKGYSHDVKSLNFNTDTMPIQSGMNITVELAGGTAGEGATARTIAFDDLDPLYLTWGFTEPDKDEYIYDANVTLAKRTNGTCLLSVGNLSDDNDVDFVAKYKNGASYGNSTIVEGPVIARVHLVARRDIPQVEAHLSETAMKVQIYSGKNLVPVTIRTRIANQSQYLKYKIIGTVQLTNEELSKLVTVSVDEDGKSINLKATNDIMNMTSKEISALLKKKFITGFNITANVYGNTISFTTLENMTVTFGSTKPATKDVTVGGTLEFDSYFATLETRAIPFSGAKVKEVVPVDAKALAKLGFEVVNKTSIRSTSAIPVTKSGSFKVKAVLDDSEVNNLETGYSVLVTVKYKVTSSAPKLKVDRTTVTLNSKTNDCQQIGISFTGLTDKKTMVGYNVLDAKGNRLGKALYVDVEYEAGYSDGTVMVGVNSNTTVGTTYKLQIIPFNYESGRAGAAKIVTVKTVAAASVAKTSVSVKGSGGIDVFIPSKIITMTFTGKNINLYGRRPDEFKVTLKNGTDVTDLFDRDYNTTTSTLRVAQKTTGSGEYPFVGKGLEGQKITVTAGFNITNSMIYGSYSTKIASTKYTPKLAMTKLSVNPDCIFNGTYYDIEVTDAFSWHYVYKITMSEDAPFEAYVMTADYEPYNAYIHLVPDYDDIGKFAGKTFDVKLTPIAPKDAPAGKVGTATLKVTVLNPVKNQAAIKAKAKGSIDAVKDTSNVTFTVSFKNTYVADADLHFTTVSNVTRVVGGKTVPEYGNFRMLYTGDGNSITLRREPGCNLAAGTYKAEITTRFVYSGGIKSLTTTVNFKVVRGKTGTTVKPSPIKLVNRDFARSATVYIAPKTAGVNAISDVKISKAYNKSMKITKTGNGVYKLEFVDGYVETSIIKKIEQAITKFVTKTVPLEVYYTGSTTPDKVNAKIKINP